MQAYFRMNNDILDLGLSPNEIKVAVCLYSCVFKNNYCIVSLIFNLSIAKSTE